MRVYTRQLVHLTQDRTRYWQRLEKLLEDALCKLSSVASKLAGSQSCTAMIRAMIAGERDPHALAELAMGPMRAKRAELAKAFTGMRFGEQHAFAAAAHLRAIEFLDAEISALEDQVEAHLAAVPAAWGVDADGATGPDAGRGPDAAVLAAADRLDEIPGVSRQMALGLIAEIGLDMSRFPTPGHLVSWAGLAPVAVQSGPAPDAGRRARATSTPGVSPPWPPAPPRTRPPSSASGTAGSPAAPAAAAPRPAARSAGPSSSSSGTSSPTPPPATATSARTTTPATPTRTARPAATSASSRPSATTSSSLPATRPPDPQPDA
jgi:hypothetical protein